MVFVDHFLEYFYAHLIRGASYKVTSKAKEAQESLIATHGTSFCIYMEDNRIFSEALFKG